MINYLLLQAAQATVQAVAAQPEPISASILIYAIGGAIVAIASLFAWIVKTSLPKILESFEKRTNSLDKMVEAFPATLERIDVRTVALTTAIDKLPDALIKGFAAVSNDIRNDVKNNQEEAKDQIITAIQDNRLEEIASKLEKCPKQ